MLITELCIIVKIWKLNVYQQMNGYIYIYIYVYIDTHTMKYKSAIKKNNEILPLAATWMDLESLMLSEISHPE